MIKNWEVGEYGEYLDDYRKNPEVESFSFLCCVPPPAAVAWVKSVPEAHRMLPQVECVENISEIHHKYSVRGWMNKGFVIIDRRGLSVLVLYHHDFTFRLYEIYLKS